MEKQTRQVATLANLIEIGKRVVLRQKSDSIQIPPANPGDLEGMTVDLGARVSEDMGAALLRAIKEKEAKEGVTNAQ